MLAGVVTEVAAFGSLHGDGAEVERPLVAGLGGVGGDELAASVLLRVAVSVLRHVVADGEQPCVGLAIGAGCGQCLRGDEGAAGKGGEEAVAVIASVIGIYQRFLHKACAGRDGPCLAVDAGAGALVTGAGGVGRLVRGTWQCVDEGFQQFALQPAVPAVEDERQACQTALQRAEGEGGAGGVGVAALDAGDGGGAPEHVLPVVGGEGDVGTFGDDVGGEDASILLLLRHGEVEGLRREACAGCLLPVEGGGASASGGGAEGAGDGGEGEVGVGLRDVGVGHEVGAQMAGGDGFTGAGGGGVVEGEGAQGTVVGEGTGQGAASRGCGQGGGGAQGSAGGVGAAGTAGAVGGARAKAEQYHQGDDERQERQYADGAHHGRHQVAVLLHSFYDMHCLHCSFFRVIPHSSFLI